MIEYIINNSFGCKVYQTNQEIQIKASNLSVIKQICIDHFFTYEGYLKAVQARFGKQYKIPLYIQEDLIFIPTKRVRDYENVWVNFASVTNVIEVNSAVMFEFESKKKMIIDISMKTLRKQIKHLEVIHNVKVKHFHF